MKSWLAVNIDGINSSVSVISETIWSTWWSWSDVSSKVFQKTSDLACLFPVCECLLDVSAVDVFHVWLVCWVRAETRAEWRFVVCNLASHRQISALPRRLKERGCSPCFLLSLFWDQKHFVPTNLIRGRFCFRASRCVHLSVSTFWSRRRAQHSD